MTILSYLIQLEIRIDNPARQLKLRGTQQKKLYPIFTKQELESILSVSKTEIMAATESLKRIKEQEELELQEELQLF